jgi:hypothetical protein
MVNKVDNIIKYWLVACALLAFFYCFFYNSHTDYFFGFDLMSWLLAIVIYIPLLSIMFFGQRN